VVTRPKVLLLDEPFGALDKKLRESMQVDLRLLQQQLGITTIFVTHDQEEALTLADRIAVMRHGRLEQVGTPRQIYEAPRSRFVADFIGVSNFFHGRAIDVQHDGVLGSTQRGMPIRVRPLADKKVRRGDLLRLAWRPEKVLLAPPLPADTPHTQAATIQHIVYLGTVTHFYTRTGYPPSPSGLP
jgi:ABC-type Fe3+/spermidine/putrescine transport system ATPase subunit